MLSAINSTQFTSANNYKRAYTNTNQNAVGYQQSFGAARPSRILTLLGAAWLAIMPSFAKAEGKAKLASITTDAAASMTKRAPAKVPTKKAEKIIPEPDYESNRKSPNYVANLMARFYGHKPKCSKIKKGDFTQGFGEFGCVKSTPEKITIILQDGQGSYTRSTLENGSEMAKIDKDITYSPDSNPDSCLCE